MNWRELPKEWQAEARRRARDYINAGYDEIYRNEELGKPPRVKINSREVTEYLDTSEKDWVILVNKNTGKEYLDIEYPEW